MPFSTISTRISRNRSFPFRNVNYDNLLNQLNDQLVGSFKEAFAQAIA